jgi:hypothetical protein
MTGKFTPGPWELQDGNHPNADGKDREIVSEHTVICAWWNWDDRREERLANAHLIAAAPDGYALAEQYRNDMMFPNLDEGQRQRRIEAIDAFLKKARGE